MEGSQKDVRVYRGVTGPYEQWDGVLGVLGVLRVLMELWGSAQLLCSAPQPRGGWRYGGTEGFYKGFIGTQGGIWKDHEKMLGFIEGLWGPYKLGWGPFGGPNGAVGSAWPLCSTPHPNGNAGSEGFYKGFIGTHGGIWKDHKKMLGVIEGLWGPNKLGWGPWGPNGAVGVCTAFVQRPPPKWWELCGD